LGTRSDIDTVIDLLSCSEYPRLEKVNLFICNSSASSVENAGQIAPDRLLYGG
jgi:hypothetical protein